MSFECADKIYEIYLLYIETSAALRYDNMTQLNGIDDILMDGFRVGATGAFLLSRHCREDNVIRVTLCWRM